MNSTAFPEMHLEGEMRQTKWTFSFVDKMYLFHLFLPSYLSHGSSLDPHGGKNFRQQRQNFAFSNKLPTTPAPPTRNPRSGEIHATKGLVGGKEGGEEFDKCVRRQLWLCLLK